MNLTAAAGHECVTGIGYSIASPVCKNS